MEKLKIEMLERMKRKGQALINDGGSVELLVKIPVQELNAPAGTTNKPAAPIVQVKQPRAEDAIEPTKKDKKKKKKRAKGIEDFMDDEKEAAAFLKEEEKTAQSAPTEKKKKSVGFNLDQNEVKVFDKTKKIAEMPAAV